MCKGFRYFESYMRGREELILRVYNDRKTPRDRGSYTATASITSRYHGKLFLSPQIQEIIAKNQLTNNDFRDFASLPPASPCDRELENEKDKTAFLIAGYAKYKCPYVWIRSNHEKMGITNSSEKDLPLRLATVMNWRQADEIKVWDIIAELIGNALQPPPANPFAIDHEFFDVLSVEESLVVGAALLSFLWKIYQSNYPFKDLILKDIELLSMRHMNEFQDLVVFGTGKRETNHQSSVMSFLSPQYQLMTRGDQRERAREKNQKKQAGKNKGTKLEDGLTLAQKRERDNEIIRQKQLKKLEEQQQGSASNSKK